MTLLGIILTLIVVFLAALAACHLILTEKPRGGLRATGTGWTPEKEERLHSALAAVLARAYEKPGEIDPEVIRDAYEADRAKSAPLVSRHTDINS